MEAPTKLRLAVPTQFVLWVAGQEAPSLKDFEALSRGVRRTLAPLRLRLEASKRLSFGLPMHLDPSDIVTAIQRLEQEIDSLSEQQAEALRTATFVGTTADEANEYDERHQKITDLVQQLALAQKAQ